MLKSNSLWLIFEALVIRTLKKPTKSLRVLELLYKLREKPFLMFEVNYKLTPLR